MTPSTHRAIRTRLALSFSAEARLLGVPERTVRAWESDHPDHARAVPAIAAQMLRLMAELPLTVALLDAWAENREPGGMAESVSAKIDA
jgi:DNA-binding transcriptional regulator YiaG